MGIDRLHASIALNGNIALADDHCSYLPSQLLKTHIHTEEPLARGAAQGGLDPLHLLWLVNIDRIHS